MMENNLKVNYIPKKIIFNKTLIEILIFFVLVPSFLTIVYCTDLNKSFFLYPDDATLFTIYFSNFAHANNTHFLGNFIYYIIIIGFVFLSENLLNIRKRIEFYLDISVIFILVPIIVSTITLSKSDILPPPYMGFSGVVSALVGYSFSLYIVYLYKIVNLKSDRIWIIFSMLVIFNLLVITFLRPGFNNKFFIIITLMLSLFIFGLSDFVKIYSYAIKNIYESKKLYVVGFLVIMLLLLDIILWLNLFPENILNNKTVTNIWGHYAGYVLGVYSPAITYFMINFYLCLKNNASDFCK